MANTASAKKAIRSSARKRQHNQFWKNRIKRAVQDLQKSLASKASDTGILNSQLTALQKVVDKAAKEKVIHKNKSNRIKARYAKKIAAQQKKQKPDSKVSGSKETSKAGKAKAKGTKKK